MKEEDFDKKLADLEGRITNVLIENTNQLYAAAERMRSDIKAERVELEDKLVKAEARLKIYEAMFEKLNLNINLDQRGEEEE